MKKRDIPTTFQPVIRPVSPEATTIMKVPGIPTGITNTPTSDSIKKITIAKICMFFSPPIIYINENVRNYKTNGLTNERTGDIKDYKIHVFLTVSSLGVSLAFTIFTLLILPLEESLNISRSLAG